MSQYEKTKEVIAPTGKWKRSSIILAIDTENKGFKIIELDKDTATIGTNPACEVPLDDPYISREHCRVFKTGSELVIKDLKSTNGTFIGKIRINEASLLGEEVISVGKTKIRIRLQNDPAEMLKNISDKMIGESEPMQNFFAKLNRFAKSDVNVCITGESGTGKDLAARTIHELSTRGSRPFIAVNCGAFPANLIESQLFGHEKGAFTGAVESTRGYFEQANLGTLFLDEIGEMPLELQSRLLRVLEDKSVRRVGGKSEIKTDFRLITATHRDLKQLVSEGKFRFDLFWRIFVAPIDIPPLAKRGKDIQLIAKFFAKELSKEMNISFEKEAIDKLKDHIWPGNVRELKNVIQRAILNTDTGVIRADDIEIESMKTSKTLNLDVNEKEKITSALELSNGNKTVASERLGISRSTLNSKIRKYGI